MRVGDDPLPGPGMFPQWPCLRANAEKVLCAALEGDLPYGRDGRTVQPGETVAKHRLTIRHADLKAWMLKSHPGQKPAFLFDDVERQAHAAINADTFRALQADRDALRTRVENAVEAFRKLKQEKDALELERDSLRSIADKSLTVGDRAETTYLNIIGGLLHLMTSKSAAGRAQSVFESQASIISALLAYHDGKPGISHRTLEDKFAAAKKSLGN